MHSRCTAALAALGLAAVPAASQAATKTVNMGPSPGAQKILQEKHGSDSDNFYPSNVSVRVGDKVRFVPFGFHNTQFPRKGGNRSPLFVPNAPVTGAVDAAGAPFWFNNQPSFAFDAVVLKSGFGKTVSFNGTRAVNSGLPLSRSPKPFVVRFTKAGSYTYYCQVHPGMNGKVNVKSRRARVPSAKSEAARVKRQEARDIKAAASLAKTTVPANTVQVGATNGRGVESFGIFPKTLTVPAGTTVNFRMPAKSRETHSATFGPGNPEKEPNSYLGVLAKTFEGPGPYDGRSTYPSEPPGTVATLTPATHGNGFWNSGLMEAGASPLPDRNSVTFGQAGSYTFYCLIHPFMTGTVNVT